MSIISTLFASSPIVPLSANNYKNNVPDTPLSGWRRGRLAYSQGDVQRGIKIKAGKRSRRSPYSAVTQLRNDTPAGSIFELAGTKNPNSSFAQNLARRFPLGSVTRVIWKAIKDYPVSRYQNRSHEDLLTAFEILREKYESGS